MSFQSEVRGSPAREDASPDAELFLNCIPSILIGLDPAGHITRWNQAAAEIFGVDAQYARKKPLHDCGIQWLSPDIEAEIAGWLRSAAPSYRCDDVGYSRDGKARFMGLRVQRIPAEHGRPGGFILTGADVTERKRLELELHNAQRLETVGQLAAGIAHEINTPIQYVGDNLRFLQEAFAGRQVVFDKLQQLLQAGEAGEVTRIIGELRQTIVDADIDYLVEEIPKAIAQSLDGVERVATIVRAMKEFAHPGLADKAAADLNQALANALIVARNEYKYVADVETDFGPLPPVVCRITEMNQVFLNLLINAAQAIGEVMQKTAERGRITVRTRRVDDRVVISISDTGCGIPARIQSRVFDPFFTTKPVGRGTGQGLAIARSIVVEKHGGTLTFEANGTQGTTFLISVPIESAPVSAGEASGPVPETQ